MRTACPKCKTEQLYRKNGIYDVPMRPEGTYGYGARFVCNNCGEKLFCGISGLEIDIGQGVRCENCKHEGVVWKCMICPRLDRDKDQYEVK